MSNGRIKTVTACVAAFAVGGVAAFSTAGPALFADGAFSERVMALAASVVAFALIGLVFGALVPHAWRLLAGCAWAGLAVVLVVFGGEAFAATEFALLIAGFAVGDAAAALAGALLGSRLRARRRSGGAG